MRISNIDPLPLYNKISPPFGRLRNKYPASVLVLLFLFVLTACSSSSEATTDFQPSDTEADLEAMAAEYPVEYEEWAASVHGETYLSGDTNAPDCIDCHADPAAEEIHSADFLLDIPNRCARCHADAEMMARYDVSPDVYDTYLADYHGQTIAYYQATEPETYRYEAVCSDCHGSHAIYAPEDERSSVHPANLASTCRTCHHEAPEEFATAFGHYRPARTPVSRAESPVIFWVKLFYQALIPVTLGGMLTYIGLDIRHRLKSNRSKKSS